MVAKPRVITLDSSGKSKFELIVACRICPSVVTLHGKIGAINVNHVFQPTGEFAFPDNVCVQFRSPVRIAGKERSGYWQSLGKIGNVGLLLSHIETISIDGHRYFCLVGFPQFPQGVSVEWDQGISHIGIDIWELVIAFTTQYHSDYKKISPKTIYQSKIDFLYAVLTGNHQVIGCHTELVFGDQAGNGFATFGQSIEDLERANLTRDDWDERTEEIKQAKGVVRGFITRCGDNYLILEGECDNHTNCLFAIWIHNVISGLINDKIITGFN